ncbi:TPA: DedA family protein [Klebsiella quasipneumoniae subsp. quasipneumoniae]|nr:DedA family protein [Klebsiella quasipneumoniae subsp. quasipneumoniae]HBR1956918.1 DedA family protein [Klebsiella quasipneumoniae subsp. quasipneumoniae]
MSLIISLIESAQGHYPLVLLMVFLLTFTKSCALVSLAIPGTSGLLLLGTFASASLGHFLLMWSSASLGAIGGFWLSWWLGVRYRHRLTQLRWLTAERLARSRLFFQRRGLWAVFFSRFLSPLRATLPLVSGASGLPLVSGASGLPLWSFQLANVTSGLLWPFLLLSPGALSLSLW